VIDQTPGCCGHDGRRRHGTTPSPPRPTSSWRRSPARKSSTDFRRRSAALRSALLAGSAGHQRRCGAGRAGRTGSRCRLIASWGGGPRGSRPGGGRLSPGPQHREVLTGV
jgi:hypothetical protein